MTHMISVHPTQHTCHSKVWTSNAASKQQNSQLSLQLASEPDWVTICLRRTCWFTHGERDRSQQQHHGVNQSPAVYHHLHRGRKQHHQLHSAIKPLKTALQELLNRTSCWMCLQLIHNWLPWSAAPREGRAPPECQRRYCRWCWTRPCLPDLQKRDLLSHWTSDADSQVIC